MEKILLNYTHDEAVAQVTLNAPKGNVLDSTMMAELQKVLNDFKSKPGLKLITFEGAGNHFSFGASVEEHRKEQAAEMLKNFHQLFYSLIELSVPTLAKISGFCLGGGLELALMCNLLYAEESATLGQPEIVLGVFPPPASLLLPLKLGAARAEELLISGRNISGIEAAELGLVNRTFADRPSLESTVEAYIEEQILPKSASSLRLAVTAARSAFNVTLLEHLPRLEKLYTGTLMETHDANEGIKAFLEKRKPQWRNG